jgi:hypothetical protein
MVLIDPAYLLVAVYALLLRTAASCANDSVQPVTPTFEVVAVHSRVCPAVNVTLCPATPVPLLVRVALT